MKARIAVLAGDGIGPEVMAEAVGVLKAVAEKGGHSFEFQEGLIGAIAAEKKGDTLPDETLELCRQSDAVLLGAVSGTQEDDPSAKVRPEKNLLGLRKGLGLFANLRPVRAHAGVRGLSTIKPEVLEGVDLLIVRELTGGIYFGEKERDETSARDTCFYTVAEIERIARVAFGAARLRRKKVASVDKANVLETSRLWRATVERIAKDEFAELELEHLLVDAAAMHLIRRPADFDVIVTENMFGDILSDEASMLAGSMGMLPSASLGEGKLGLYEPVHGSAPDIAGRGVANPYGMILSAAMMLRHSLGLDAEADAVERAVSKALDRGILTPDLAPKAEGAAKTAEAGAAVRAAL